MAFATNRGKRIPRSSPPAIICPNASETGFAHHRTVRKSYKVPPESRNSLISFGGSDNRLGLGRPESKVKGSAALKMTALISRKHPRSQARHSVESG